MTPRYFDVNGKELVIGTHISSPEEAAYIATDPNDIIFRKLPSNKVIKIVNGSVTIADAKVTRADLMNFNKEQNKSRIRSGIVITGLYKVNGAFKAAHRETVRITDTLKSDVESIFVGFAVAGETDPTALEVSTDIYLIISNEAQARELFLTGKRLITTCYAAAETGREMIRNATEEELPTLRSALRLMWSQISIEGTL